uniref:Uncharacterized protein n=1 Tax=Rhizophora mucronata TaxID=61149 RepID=A0A2P2PGP6_RHIMU
MHCSYCIISCSTAFMPIRSLRMKECCHFSPHILRSNSCMPFLAAWQVGFIIGLSV